MDFKRQYSCIMESLHFWLHWMHATEVKYLFSRSWNTKSKISVDKQTFV